MGQNRQIYTIRYGNGREIQTKRTTLRGAQILASRRNSDYCRDIIIYDSTGAAVSRRGIKAGSKHFLISNWCEPSAGLGRAHQAY